MPSHARLGVRFVSLVTLLTFFPSSIGVWNFMPQGWVVAEAEEPKPDDPSGVDVAKKTSPLTQPLPLLTETELKQALGGPGDLAKLIDETPEQTERRLRVAQAALALPTAEVLLASIPKPDAKKPETTEPEPLKVAQLFGGGREVRGPLGPQEAVTALNEADTLKNSGQYSDALVAYFDVMDQYPGTNEALWADQGMWDILNALEAGTISRPAVSAFEGHLATWSPQTVDGAYAALTYYAERALAESRAGNTEAAGQYAGASRNTSWTFFNAYPGHYLSMSATHYFYESSQLLGRETESASMAQLREFARASRPGQARMGAWYCLALYYGRMDINARGDAGVACSNVIGESTRPYVQSILNDPGIPFWVKGYIGEYVGWAYADLGKFAEAKQWYDLGLSHCTRVGPTHRYLAYRSAQMTQLMNKMDPNAQAAAFQTYLATYPDSEFASLALLTIASIYMLASDYRGAADIFREVVQRHPGTNAAQAAEGELDYIVRNLYDSAPRLAAKNQPMSTDEIRLAQVCGPTALKELLAAKRVTTSVEELATLANTDEAGTTMLGLIEAAQAKGVPLTGVSANNVRELTLPAIAFVNRNHFVLVKEVRGDAVIVWDGPHGESPLTLAEFSAMWDGQALVTDTGMNEVMTVAALETSKGGDTTSQAPNMNVQPNESYQGFTGGAGFGGVSPEGIAKGPHVATSVTSPGVNMEVISYETCIDMRENDITLCSRGPLSLFWGRVHINEKGYPRSGATGRMGQGWADTLAIYAHLSDLSDPDDPSSYPWTITLYDSTGTPRIYDYDGGADGYHIYKRSSTGQTSERGITIRYKESTMSSQRKVYADFPSGLQYEFASAGNDPGGAAVRLNYIRDANNGNAITFVYNGTSNASRLTKVQGPLGDARHLFMSYDGNARITKVELKANTNVLQTVTYEYDTGRLTKVTDNDSKTVKYQYQSQGGGSLMITKITDKANRDTTLAWYFADDASGAWGAYKIEITNAGGMKQVFDRSVSTSINTITPQDGATALGKSVMTPLTGDASRTRYEDTYSDASTYDRWSYEYDGSDDLTKTLRPDSAVDATYTYTATGRISTVADNDGTMTDFDYASSTALQPTKVTDPAGLATNYSYDSYNRLTKVIPPQLGSNGVVMAFDAYGQVTSTTNPSSQAVTYGYDDCGYLTSVKDPLNNETKYEYDNYGNMTKQIDPRNKATYFYYTSVGCGGCGGKGLLTKVKDALNNETLFAYDTNGNKTKVTDALNRATDYFFDTMNRLTKVESLSGSGTYMTYEYDLLGQLTKTTDFEGKVVNYFYDWFGDLTKQSDGVGTYVEYTYDWWDGNLETVKDGGGNVTAYEYDLDGQLTKVTYADGKVTKYFYDAAGRQMKVGAGASGTTDPTEWFYHGTTGQVTKVRYTAGGNTFDTGYAYNANGQLTKLTDWIDNTDGLRYAYDNAGRLTKLTDYDDSYLTYAYDAAGNVTNMTDYHGSAVTYTYTDRNEISTITAPGSKVWNYHYNVIGQPTKYTHPNGMTTNYSYDTRNRLSKIEHKDGANVLDGFTYAMDKNGNITKTTHQDSAYWDYWYDLRNRLTKAERKTSGGSLLKRWTYTYSLADNMTTKETYDGSTTETYTYAFTPGNELTKQTLSGTDTHFSYDAWGRMVSKWVGGGSSANYYWNYGDKLTKVSSNFAGEGTVVYNYGGDGKRRQRVSGGATTWYNYDRAWNLLNEEDGSDNLTMTYVHDPVKPIGTVLADLAGGNPATGTARYYHQDNIGSTRRLRDSNKNSLGQYEYEPYGADYATSGAAITDKFTGHDWDDTSDLYYAPYRYYSPSLARWLSRDKLGMVDGINVFIYVLANPVNGYDALGDKCSRLDYFSVGSACLLRVWAIRGAILNCGKCAVGILSIIGSSGVALLAGLGILYSCAKCGLAIWSMRNNNLNCIHGLGWIENDCQGPRKTWSTPGSVSLKAFRWVLRVTGIDQHLPDWPPWVSRAFEILADLLAAW